MSTLQKLIALRVRLLSTVLVLSIAVVFAACERRGSTVAERVDYFGNPIPSLSNVDRIVSLGPSSTEILYMLGAGDRIVGRSRWDTWPEEVKAIPEIGDAIRPGMEKILELKPQLVVLYAAQDNREAAEFLSRSGVNVVSLRIDRIEEYLSAVELMGELTDHTERADSIVRSLRSELDSVRSSTEGRPRPTVFMPVWENPLMTLGMGSYLSELVEIAGGRNVYSERQEPSFTVSLEDVIQRNPDVVLVTPASASRILKDTQWRALRAVREGRMLTYDTLLVSQPSTRLGRAARFLAALIHSH